MSCFSVTEYIEKVLSILKKHDLGKDGIRIFIIQFVNYYYSTDRIRFFDSILLPFFFSYPKRVNRPMCQYSCHIRRNSQEFLIWKKNLPNKNVII